MSKMPKNVTMKEVAIEAGVHQTTVSLALRNHHSIPEKTRERIKAAADAMGYRPNPLVSALISERKKNKPRGDGSTLAFLTHYATPDGWRHSTNYRRLFEAMTQRADQLGYRIEEFWMHEKAMTPLRMVQILRNRGIRGIVLCPFPESEVHFDFDFREFAAVAIGLTMVEPPLDRATIDYAGLMQECVDRLLHLGYSRIGFLSHTVMDDRVRHLSLGAFEATRYHRADKLLQPCVFERSRMEELEPWIRSAQPDALIVSNTPEYFSLQKVLERMNLGGPNPEIVSVDSDLHLGEVPGMVQDIQSLAEASIDFLTSRVERGIVGIPGSPQTITIGGRWRRGNPDAGTAPNLVRRLP